MNSRDIVRGLIAILAAAGAFSGGQISYVHATGIESCPMLGPLPACYLVLAGYLAMLASAAWPNRWLFVSGLLPVLALATMGVAGELLSDEPVCPQTERGVPKCYFSFAMASVLAFLGWLNFRTHGESAN